MNAPSAENGSAALPLSYTGSSQLNDSGPRSHRVEPFVSHELREHVDARRRQRCSEPLVVGDEHDTARRIGHTADTRPDDNARRITKRTCFCEHAERCLGHTIVGVEGTYNRHAYEAEMLQAYEALAVLLERIVNPPEGNVTQISRARG